MEPQNVRESSSADSGLEEQGACKVGSYLAGQPGPSAESDTGGEEFGARYLRKLRSLSKQAHLERMNDLLRRIRARLPELEELLKEMEDHWGEEDKVYRFYHQSFKVFYLQDLTKQGFRIIEKIGGEQDPPHEWYCLIVKEGTARGFSKDTNEHWLEQTRPVLEAFWHTKYFVEMMVKYAKELESAPNAMPSGWAALLYLFELR